MTRVGTSLSEKDWRPSWNQSIRAVSLELGTNHEVRGHGAAVVVSAPLAGWPAEGGARRAALGLRRRQGGG